MAENTESSLPDPLDDDLDELIVTAMEDCTTSVLRPSNIIGPPELVEGFDREAGQTWIYPMNKEYREYQFNIVRKSLFQNTLVCLPTGLGKTFIAAVLMYNYYRWFPRAKVIFMAPTKPLVAQQMGACFEVMGIPQDHMCEMTGSMSPGIREIAWHEKRVFFLTPQIISNDISREICPANLICCVVIDEAHKALGNHAYVQVVQELLKYNGGHFRVLAMSATPGSGYQQIRQVIQNLLVANVELRSEDSPDIVPYTHTRLLEKVVVPLNDELQEARTSLINVISVYVTRLHQSGCLYHGNPEQLSKYLLLKERERFRQNPPDGLSRFRFGIIEGDFAISISLLHALDLLQFYGLQSFNVYCQELLHGDKGQPTTRYELQHNVIFCMLMDRVKRKFSTSSPTPSPSFKFNGYSHPKFQKLEEIVLAHFANAQHEEGEKFVETRIIIFAQYRETVREIEAVLNRHKPQVRPIVLLGQGQGSAKSVNQPSTGLKQKVQLQVMTKFRSGECNVLVATCIGEEGLDIGDVDLIICFDAQKSPVRLIQRMGRTGRKRNGRVVILMTQGKEENAHKQGQYNSKVVNQAMVSALSPCELYSNNPRMVPSDLEPVCRKMFLKCGTFIHKRTDKASVTNSAKGWKLQMAESPYLTDAQLAEWKARFYIPFLDVTHLEMDAKTICLHTSSAVTRNKDRLRDTRRLILSISEWLPWQNTLQLTSFVEHSKRTELLVDTMKSLEVLQYQDGTQCEIDVASHFNIDDVLLPGQQESWRQSNLVSRGRISGRHVRAKRRVTLALSSDEDDFVREVPLRVRIESGKRAFSPVNVDDDLDHFQIEVGPGSSFNDENHVGDFFKIIRNRNNSEEWRTSKNMPRNDGCQKVLRLRQTGVVPSLKTPPLPRFFDLLDDIDVDFFSLINQHNESSKTRASNRDFLFKTPNLVKTSHLTINTRQTQDPQEVTNESLYSMTQLLSIIDHNTMELTSPKRSSPGQKITSLLPKESQVVTTQPNSELVWDSDDDDFLGEFDMLPFSSTKCEKDETLIGSDCDTDEIIPPSPMQSPTTVPQFFSKHYRLAGSISTASTSTPLVPANVEIRTKDAAATTLVSPTCRSSVSPCLVGNRVQRKMLPRCRLSEVKVVDSETETFRPFGSKTFLDDEASVDGGPDNITSDEASEQSNSFDDAFINDVATQGNYNNTTMYLRSIKSPHCRPGAYKLFGAANNDKRCENVFSQPKSSPDSEYLEDSFCVGSNDDDDNDESPTVPIPRKRRRIVIASDNSTSSEEPYLKSPGTGPALPNVKPILPSYVAAASRSESPPVIILVDSQEISSSQNIISELRLKHKAQVIVAQLGSCDWILSRRLAVECKLISDLTNGAQHKKLLECVKEMSTNYQRWVVLVETRNHDPKTVRATLTRHMANTLVCLVDVGRVIFTSSKEHTAEVLYDLAYSEARSGHALNHTMDVKNSPIFSFYRKLAMNNYIIALNLLDGFSTPNYLFHCSPKEIADCSKCPFQKAETIFHNIQRVFNSCRLDN